MKDDLNNLRKRLMHQALLFHRISNLNDRKLSVRQLLTEAVERIPEGWPESSSVESSIDYDGIAYQTSGFRKSDRMLSSSTTVRTSNPLLIKIAIPDNGHSAGSLFGEEDQILIDAIATNLALKIENILTKTDLAENQKLLDKAYRLARIGTWEYDMITGHLEWSDMTKEVHGFGTDYEPDVDSTIQLFKEGYDREVFAQAAYDAINHEKPFDIELKIISGKGDERWIRAVGQPEYRDGVCFRSVTFWLMP